MNELLQIEYFGTNLTEHGHYRFVLYDSYESYMVKYTGGFNDLPFHPEYLTNNLPKGEVIFYQGGGFTVLGIAGSCKDERPGTKTVFWVKKIITGKEFIQLLKENKQAMKIIDALPFQVKWEFFSA